MFLPTFNFYSFNNDVFTKNGEEGKNGQDDSPEQVQDNFVGLHNYEETLS